MGSVSTRGTSSRWAPCRFGSEAVWPTPAGTSSPWGLLAKLIEQGGGSVQYTYLHAADLIRKRNEPFEKEESDG